MSGHSHAKTVAATKNANDAKKGKIFSKMGRVITIAVKQGGSDPTSNMQLKAAIERARSFNMPKDNIERAVKKGTGELAGENLEEVAFEALGPGGIALIITGITDNTNRALGEIKGILSQYGGKMAGEGAVRWMFEQKGLIQVPTSADIENVAIEAGADDIKTEGQTAFIYTKPEDFETVKKALTEKSVSIQESSLEWVPKEEVALGERDKEKANKLFEALDENDAVQDIYSNLK